MAPFSNGNLMYQQEPLNHHFRVYFFTYHINLPCGIFFSDTMYYLLLPKILDRAKLSCIAQSNDKDMWQK